MDVYKGFYQRRWTGCRCNAHGAWQEKDSEISYIRAIIKFLSSVSLKYTGVSHSRVFQRSSKQKPSELYTEQEIYDTFANLESFMFLTRGHAREAMC
jgi:hypothetical protein